MNYKTLSASTRWVLPLSLKRSKRSDWATANLGAQSIGCFLEGPSFDRAGNLLVVDIPFGRVFSISSDGDWQLLCEYDGWPNGLKLHRDGRIFIADYRRGILQLINGDSAPIEVVSNFHSEGFKGCNDLFFDSKGGLWFTDQGQTGLHDSTGRLYRLATEGHLNRILENIPSPNGLVMNLQENQLYVAVTRANAVWRVPLISGGGVSKVGAFVQLSGGVAGPDGLALDMEGGLIVAHPGIGVWRFDKRGRPTHLVESPDEVVWTNIAFGGEENRELFLVDSIGGAIHCTKMPYPGTKMYSHAALDSASDQHVAGMA